MATTVPVTGDQAERYLFTALPMLGARERRALALAELGGANRMAIASQTGLSGDELSATLARARKALRRAHVALPAGGRCERTERLVSDALDVDLPESAARRRDAHLARCPRCREHVTALDTARTVLRDGFAASLTVEPVPIVAPAPAPMVPAAKPAPAPAPAPTSVAPPADTDDEATLVAPPAPAVAVSPAPPAPARRPAHPRARRAATVLAALLVVLAAILGAAAALDGGDHATERAPWSAPDAPDVRPAPLDAQ